jgi:hypothetical protein
MLRHLLPVFLAAVFALGGVACSKKKTSAEMQADKVNAFRERQRGEAIKAYTALTTKYPDSEYAAKAQERLTALGPPPATPAPKKK